MLSMEGLVVRQHPVDVEEKLPTLGSLLDPDKAKMEVAFTRVGGGIESITFSNIWDTAAARRQAESYYAAKSRGSVEGYSLPPDDQRFVLRRMQAVPYAGQSIKISLMAASGLQVQWQEGEEVVSLQSRCRCFPISIGSPSGLACSEPRSRTPRANSPWRSFVDSNWTMVSTSSSISVWSTTPVATSPSSGSSTDRRTCDRSDPAIWIDVASDSGTNSARGRCQPHGGCHRGRRHAA